MASPTSPLANRRFQDEIGNRIVPGVKLGEGGEGTVYLVPGSTQFCHEDLASRQNAAGCRRQARPPGKQPCQTCLGAAWKITWPQYLLRENGVTASFTMSILDPSQSWEPIVEYYNRRAAHVTEQEQGRELRMDDRVRMARNLALGFRAVHHAGYVIGDVNDKNVEVNRQNDIALVDCDSYGFADRATGRTYSNHMGGPSSKLPRRREITRTGPKTTTALVWR